MKTLLLMRHAKASQDAPVPSDHDRPLAGRGRKDAPRMGRWLVQQKLLPDVICSSTAIRAQETARLVREELPEEIEIRWEPSLYMAGVERWLEVLRALPIAADCVLSVAHNPGLEELLQALSGECERMATATIAHLELDIDDWSEIAPRANPPG